MTPKSEAAAAERKVMEQLRELCLDAIGSLYTCEMALAVPPKRAILAQSYRARLAALAAPSGR